MGEDSGEQSSILECTFLNHDHEEESGYVSNLSSPYASSKPYTPCELLPSFSRNCSDITNLNYFSSTECKIFNSTPYSDFIDKLKSSDSPIYKRSPFGKSSVDFLYFLGIKENHSPVLNKIFSYLSNADLYSASRVSKTWNQILLSNPVTYKRIEDFQDKSFKENENSLYRLLKPVNMESTEPLVKRVRLMEIQNKVFRNNSSNYSKQSPIHRSPPISPSKVRFHLFQKEGQKLDPGERLLQCPRCSLPSRQVKIENLGVCTRQGCQFQFCLSCFCEFNGPHHCSFVTPRFKSRNTFTIGSKASRRLLRRL